VDCGRRELPAFEVADRDHDGVINRAEYAEVMSSQGGGWRGSHVTVDGAMDHEVAVASFEADEFSRVQQEVREMRNLIQSELQSLKREQDPGPSSEPIRGMRLEREEHGGAGAPEQRSISPTHGQARDFTTAEAEDFWRQSGQDDSQMARRSLQKEPHSRTLTDKSREAAVEAVMRAATAVGLQVGIPPVGERGGERSVSDILQMKPSSRRQVGEQINWRVGFDDRSVSKERRDEPTTSTDGDTAAAAHELHADKTGDNPGKQGGGWRSIKAGVMKVPTRHEGPSNGAPTQPNADQNPAEEGNAAPEEASSAENPTSPKPSKWAGIKGGVRTLNKKHIEKKLSKDAETPVGSKEESETMPGEPATRDLLTGMGNEVNWVRCRCQGRVDVDS